MKRLHKPEFFCWSVFDEERNIDFHSYLWLRETGNVVFDPLPLNKHDKKHLQALGPVSHILISNSDHVRDAEALASWTQADIFGPEDEKNTFPIECSHWLKDGEEVLPELTAYKMHGSKTAGELAFLIANTTLITGDLIRAHEGGQLCLLPDAKLTDKNSAIASVKQLASIETIDAILPGDGWPVFRDGQKVLADLVAILDA